MPDKEPKIAFKRKIYDKLLRWKNECGGQKALLIEGARRVGKTFLLKDAFAREYRESIYIDFSRVTKDVRGFFEEGMEDLDEFFDNISSHFKKTLYERDTLFIFDEIQKFPRARECIQYLVEDGRYDYVETGSLLSLYRNKMVDGEDESNYFSSIPPNEDTITLYPLDFEEFCWAIGESEKIDTICECFKNPGKLTDSIHAEATFLFREYMLIGGMPSPVKKFILTGKDVNNLKGVNDEKQAILNLYGKDLSYVPALDKRRTVDIFKDISGRLSKHEQKIMYSESSESPTDENYEGIYSWLGESMMCNICYRCNEPHVSLTKNMDSRYVKCYMGDTGLLYSQAFGQSPTFNNKFYNKILRDALHENEGILYENVVAQMIVSSGRDLFFYVKHKNDKGSLGDIADANADEMNGDDDGDIEIDFLINTLDNQGDNKISTIEVKSGDTYTTISHDKFRERNHKNIGTCYVVHPLKVKKDKPSNVIAIPIYMMFCIL